MPGPKPGIASEGGSPTRSRVNLCPRQSLSAASGATRARAASSTCSPGTRSVIARYSAGNNAGHTDHQRPWASSPCTSCRPASSTPRRRASIGNGVAIDPAVLLDEIDSLERAASAREQPVRQRPRPRDHALPPDDRPAGREAARRCRDRHDRAAASAPASPTRSRASASAWATSSTRRRSASACPSSCRTRTRCSRSSTAPSRSTSTRSTSRTASTARGWRRRVRDTSLIAREALDRGEKVLLEGAQGCLLDLDARYLRLRDVVGAVVDLCRRRHRHRHRAARHHQGRRRLQGLHDARRQRADADASCWTRRATSCRSAGPRPEIGTTTGRTRRTGWFDAVASRYSASVNSVTAVALTRLDVLDDFPSIQVCTAYEIDGKQVEYAAGEHCRLQPRQAHPRRAARLARDLAPTHASSRSCRRTPSATYAACRSSSASRSRSSRSARSASRSS